MVRSERETLYEWYATTHAGVPGILTKANSTQDAVLRRDVIDRLPDDFTGKVIDLGCGRGELVSAMQAAGYTAASGVDISPEQVAIAHRRGIVNVTEGNVLELLTASPGVFAAVTATDFLEHLTRAELLDLMPRIRYSLREGGVLVARVPNAVSPFSGNYRHGDFTHESWFTARSVRQLANVSGFSRVDVYPCRPTVHSMRSAIRRAAWAFYDAFFRIALVAETGYTRGHVVTQNLVFVAHQ